MSISSRFQIYIRATAIYVVSLLLTVLVIHLASTFGNGQMTLVSGILLVVVMIKFPIDIGNRMIKPNSFSQYLTIGTVVVIWCALLFLKVEVNESSNIHSFNGISKPRRLSHYFLFSIWSLILIWETTIQVGTFLAKKFSNNH